MCKSVKSAFLRRFLGWLCFIYFFAGVTPALEAASHSLRLLLPQWQYKPGANNAITDVTGVRVAHLSFNQTAPNTPPIHTGITVILPAVQNLATQAVWASGKYLNGNGELTGLGPLQSSGLLNSPIVLVNTYAVGIAHQGVFAYYQKYFPNLWHGALPVVAECWDGFFNTITDTHLITPQRVVETLEAATLSPPHQPTQQGRVGAGTGMRAFEIHGGIGSASRQVLIQDHLYTIGVLVNINHSPLKQLNPTIHRLLETRLGSLQDIKQQADQEQASVMKLPPPRQGSIVTILATDAPLLPHQLALLCDRVALGIGAVGSSMDPSSGDSVVAFSTAQTIDVTPESQHSLLQAKALHPDGLSPLYRATVEAVTEAQINALLIANSPPNKQTILPLIKKSSCHTVYSPNTLKRLAKVCIYKKQPFAPMSPQTKCG